MNEAKALSWGSFLMTLGGSVAAVVIWAYSNFIPRQERDVLKPAYDQRIAALETRTSVIELNQKEGMQGQARIEGKMDSMFTMLQEALHNGRRDRH